MKKIQALLPMPLLKTWVLATGIAVLTACSGGGGADVEETNSGAPTNPGTNYSGPPPASDDVQRFKINVWDNLARPDRCGTCHGTGGQTPQFARSDDINLAYAAANTVVNLTRPVESRMVTKVGEGHNCWLASNGACADTITSYITNWAGGSTGGAATEVVLTVPETIFMPGSARSFPSDTSLFSTTIYPVVKQYCSRCHSDTAGNSQSPFFASDDIDVAYAAVQSKLNLDNVPMSRLVVRLRSEFHNCWDNCTNNSNTMEAAIQQFVDGIPLTEVDPDLVISSANRLINGIVASSGGRFDANTIARWEFKTGSGSIAYDTSGVEPALNLTLSGGYDWVGGWGVQFTNGRAQGSTANSKKLHDLIKATGEFSVEAWVAPENVVQDGPARIITYSAGPTRSNFTVGQTQYNYDYLLRHTNTGADGQPVLSTADDDERLQATLQHIVMTYDPIRGRRMYVNGEYTGDIDPQAPGNLNDWDSTYAFVLGNETNGQLPFAGIMKLVAIHNRVLSDEQIAQNFDAGVGERYYLLFNVSHLLGVPECTVNNVPQCYIAAEVSRFDSYGYLFNTPFFASLNSAATFNGIPVQGMRIGINGRESPVGQAYGNMDTTITQVRQDLSTLGTVIGLEKGPASDEFFLTFDRIGAFTHVRLDPVPPTPLPPADGDPVSHLGVRTFDEINATLSQLTTVEQTQSDVRSLYQTIRQGLPVDEGITAFSSAHQMGITQLSIEYCNALVEDTAKRTLYFPGFNFAAQPGTAFATQAGRDLVLNPLLSRVLGSNVNTQPDDADVRGELNSLITNLSTCGNSCPANKTATIVKAVCAAAVGGAAMLVQ